MTDNTENSNTFSFEQTFNMSVSIAKLSEALSKAQGEIEHAKKDVKNEFFKSKYADLASVIAAAKIALAKNGLAVIQPSYIDKNDTVILKTVLSHSSGEWIASEYPIRPVKNGPQGTGSAMTYARRYCYSAMVGVASDDDDGNAASGNAVKPAAKESAASYNKRYTAVKNAILESEDPAATWQDHIDEINEFKSHPDNGGTYFEDLKNAGLRRKQELQLKADTEERK